MTTLRSAALAASLLLALTACATGAGTDPGQPSVPTVSIDASAPLGPQAKAAIVADDLPTVEAIVAAGLDLSSDLGGGYTPLHIAANAGLDDVVTYLIAEGAAVDARGDKGETPLMMAASNGSVPTLQALLDAGADIALADEGSGMAALHYATGVSKLDAMTALLAAGADINQTMLNGETPVLVACHRNDLASITLLTEAGADLTLRQTDTKVAPLDVATLHHQPEILAYIQAALAS